MIVQTTIEKRDRVDWRRNAVFAAFGAVYLGGVQYFLYCALFPRLFPSTAIFAAKPLRQKLGDMSGQRQVFAQVALDQLVHIPFLYYPTFYVLKASIMAGAMSADIARDALGEYSRVAWSDNLAQWSFFAPAATLNFGFSPLWLRVPVVAAMSFLWTMVLSYRRGSSREQQQFSAPLAKTASGRMLDAALSARGREVGMAAEAAARTQER